jgi:predicted ATPase
LQQLDLEPSEATRALAFKRNPKINIPIPLTSFIGREKELKEVAVLFSKSRLITLTGSGGVGKTRLAIQVVVDILEMFPDGVWFLDLAPLTDPALVASTLINVLGLRESTELSANDLLINYFRSRTALVIFDNCEHLIEACAQIINSLLGSCENLSILATSRETLRVSGELNYRVPSLEILRSNIEAGVDTFSKIESVQSFTERATLAAPNFAKDLQNVPVTAEICQRLDGIPLAIELAAARVNVLTVEQILKRLDNRFNLLTGGLRTYLPRHQTLRTTIDWSYNLLSQQEQLLLGRLSVFVGGWTLEAAESVCMGDGIEMSGILDLLTQLLNKSLVVVEQTEGMETRHRMLETIRQYAREKLLEAQGSEIIQDRHLAYFVKMVEQAEPQLYRSNQVFWMKKLEAEIDNLRMAIEWALANNVESGLRIAATPWRFWWERSYLQEVGNWLTHLLEQYKTTDTLHAQALAILSLCLFRQSDFSETIRSAKKSLHMARILSDKHTEALSLAFLGVFMVTQGNIGEGTPLLEEALAIYRLLDDKVGQADTTERLAINNNDMERAIAYAKESLALTRELGDLSGMVFRLCWLSRLMFWTGDFISPIVFLEEALSIARQLGNQTGLGNVVSTYGDLNYWQGNYSEAITDFENTIRLSEKIGNHYLILWAHVKMAYAVLREGDIQQAHEMFRRNIHRAQEAGLMIALVVTVEGLASLHINQDQPERAARLIAWADAMREKVSAFRPPVEQISVEKDLAMIQLQLDTAEFAKLSEEGKAMTMDQAIACALEEQH